VRSRGYHGAYRTSGSALGTAIAGTILVADLGSGHRSYGIAMGVLAVIGPRRPRGLDLPTGRCWSTGCIANSRVPSRRG